MESGRQFYFYFFGEQTGRLGVQLVRCVGKVCQSIAVQVRR